MLYRFREFALVLFALCLGIVAISESSRAAEITFKKIRLDADFRSEGVSVGDFNHDGKLDIGAGRVYYLAPDWKIQSMEKTTRKFDPHGYSGSFCNFAQDLNGDGWIDHIVIDFPGTPTYWYENPKNSGAPWKRHVIAPISNNESPTFLDLDGDGQRELIMGVGPAGKNPNSPERQMAFLKPRKDPSKPWKITAISKKAAPGTQRYSHGLGVGDVNGDQRSDIVVPAGWWEAPEDRSNSPWKFHKASFGPACAQMYVYDFDGDGDADILSSSAHDYGIWWHEQTDQGWKMHKIEDNFSQTHGLVLADINGDGLPDFVTGKRWWAHGPKGDRGADQPAVFIWFELQRKGGTAHWIQHQFDHNSGVGTQFEVADINGDKLLDIISSNKKGVHLFLQKRK